MTFTHDCIIITRKLFLGRKKKSLVPPIKYARMNTLYSLNRYVKEPCYSTQVLTVDKTL